LVVVPIWNDRAKTLPALISLSLQLLPQFGKLRANSYASWYRWDYVDWRIEANRDNREAVDYGGYDEHYVH
jgi:hypothetical protein